MENHIFWKEITVTFVGARFFLIGQSDTVWYSFCLVSRMNLRTADRTICGHPPFVGDVYIFGAPDSMLQLLHTFSYMYQINSYRVHSDPKQMKLDLSWSSHDFGSNLYFFRELERVMLFDFAFFGLQKNVHSFVTLCRPRYGSSLRIGCVLLSASCSQRHPTFDRPQGVCEQRPRWPDWWRGDIQLIH